MPLGGILGRGRQPSRILTQERDDSEWIESPKEKPEVKPNETPKEIDEKFRIGFEEKLATEVAKEALKIQKEERKQKEQRKEREAKKIERANHAFQNSPEFQMRLLAMEKSKQATGTWEGRRTVQLFEWDVQDRFDVLDIFVSDVILGRQRGLIVLGEPGNGKTHTVRAVIEKHGLIADENSDQGYTWNNNRVTARALYELAWRRRNGGLIILDDCTNLKDEQSIELIKALCDSTASGPDGARMITWRAVGPAGTADVSVEVAEETGKIPASFPFKGKVIVISNLLESQMNDAVLSRCVVVPIVMTKKEALDRMRDLLPDICPEMELGLKENVLEYLIEKQNREQSWADADKRFRKFKQPKLCLRTLVKALQAANGSPRREEWERLVDIVW